MTASDEAPEAGDDGPTEAPPAETASAEDAPTTADDDVVVVGGGLGGYAAALAAASERADASVRLLVTESDQFEQETGLIDVLGSVPGESRLVAEPLAAIDKLPAEHPYRRFGAEAVRSALERFDETVGERYAGSETDENGLLPTAIGNLQPAARYPAGMANGLASVEEPVRFVGFDRVPDFDAPLTVNGIRAVAPYDAEYSTIKAPYKMEEPPVTRKIARALDENRTNDEGTTARESLANTLRPVLDVEPRIGLPAVLGVTDHAAVREQLESVLQADLFEVPLGPPSIPGERLESTLAAALSTAGVSVERGVSVTGVDRSGETVEALQVARSGDETLTREGSSFVLATGGVTAGGIESDRQGMREPIFDCDVSAPEERSEWVDRAFLGDHAAVRAGVAVDDDLRAQADAETVFENLYAAGRVVAGPDVVAERSAAGVALVTGDVAGRRAVE
jgi:glycerol-3-phosphate dehydrogenase subunit B